MINHGIYVDLVTETKDLYEFSYVESHIDMFNRK